MTLRVGSADLDIMGQRRSPANPGCQFGAPIRGVNSERRFGAPIRGDGPGRASTEAAFHRAELSSGHRMMPWLMPCQRCRDVIWPENPLGRDMAQPK
jgi:hypothetical protein